VKTPIWFAVLVSGACGAAVEHKQLDLTSASLGGYAFDVPADWHRSDAKAARATTATWTPDVEGNDAKESLVVIRTQLTPALETAGMPYLEHLLADAQHELPQFQPTHAVTTFSTTRNLSGARVEVDFVPAGKKRTYHRVHALLLDGNSLIHVLYTAARPDYRQDAFNAVVNSVHRGEG